MTRVDHRLPSDVVLRLKRVSSDERAVHELLRALGHRTETAPPQGDEPDPPPLPIAARRWDGWLILTGCVVVVALLAAFGVGLDS